MLRRPVAFRRLAYKRPNVRVLHVLKTAVSSTAVGGARCFYGDHGRIGGPPPFYNWTTAGGLLFVASSSSLVASHRVALCEEEEAAAQSSEAEGEDDDPYANLPDEDEETSCVLCNTFRQGPCRPPWRQLERCFKDGDADPSGAARCTKYFMAHQECISGYTNLYQLINLDQKQELIANTEKAVAEHERVCWPKAVAENFIDWSQWRSFCKDMGKTFQESLQTKPPSGDPQAPPPVTASNNEPDTTTKPPLLLPLWKRGPENTEPLLIATEAKVPTEQNGMLLKLAYVVDQDGFALGVVFHDYYRHVLDQQEKAAAKDAKTATDSENNSGTNVDSVEKTDNDEPVTLQKDITLEFYILPSDSRTVQLCALYTEDPTKVPESKKMMDVFLYKTGEYQLKDQC
jgi:hypothetical protein